MRRRNQILWASTFGLAVVCALWFGFRGTRSQDAAVSTEVSNAVSAQIPQQQLSTPNSGVPKLLPPHRQSQHTAGSDPKALHEYLRTAELGTLPPLRVSLASEIPSLEERAKAGDTDAMVSLWYGLDQCKSIISDAQLGFLKHADPASVARFADIDKQLLDNCEGVTAEQIAGEYSWLKQAAEMGNAQAQFFYAIAGSDAVGGEQAALQNPELWAEYRNTSMSYLDSLAQQCNPGALSVLGSSYFHGNQIFNQDLTKAYMYQMVASKATDMSPTGMQVALKWIGKDMSSDQIARATQWANQFYDGRCN